MVINVKGSILSERFLSFTLDIVKVDRSPSMLKAGIINVVIKTSKIIIKAILPDTGWRDCGIKKSKINSNNVGINKGCNMYDMKFARILPTITPSLTWLQEYSFVPGT